MYEYFEFIIMEGYLFCKYNLILNISRYIIFFSIKSIKQLNNLAKMHITIVVT